MLVDDKVIPPKKRGNNGGGRQKVVINIAEVESHAARGLTLDKIADCMGFSARTLYNNKAQNAEVAAAITRGRSAGEKLIANALFTAASKGHVEAAKFYLARRCDWRETTNTELTGKNGAPVVVAAVKAPDVEGLSPADALRAYDEWMASFAGK